MPELPEVHIIVEDLKKYVAGAVIRDVSVFDNYHFKNSEEEKVAYAHVLEKIKDSQIHKAQRIAKNIVLHISNDMHIVIHLAMTGRLLLRSPNHPEDKFVKVKFHLEKNGKNFELRFCDMRMFGKVSLHENLKRLDDKYGPEPLDENLTPQNFLQIIHSKNTSIKNLLLDQSKIAGLGNVYATDALWMAQINPNEKTQNITLKQATNLLEASREILREGIKNRGITISDYVDLFGKKGNQQNYFRIYRHEKCSRCNTKVTQQIINGRNTYFCANCQKLNS